MLRSMQDPRSAALDCMCYALQEPLEPLLQPGHQVPEEGGLHGAANRGRGCQSKGQRNAEAKEVKIARRREARRQGNARYRQKILDQLNEARRQVRVATKVLADVARDSLVSAAVTHTVFNDARRYACFITTRAAAC